ncbi:MAG TPA: DUF2971 domain-containing protein, partial [Vicingus sp.]|nr:DUF2971 domain-containing protein [Vicingus sp.]
SELQFNTNNLDLWRFYGLNGDGVAIKFKILNNPLTWKSFHMSSILYGEKKAEKLKALKKRIDFLNSKYPQLHVRLTNMFSFHKSSHFRNEDEVRLIFSTYLNKNNEYSFISYHSQDKKNTLPNQPIKISNSESYFITIPLTGKENSQLKNSFFNTSPQLMIEEIILGYKFKEDELNLYRNIFRSIIETSNGLEIEPEKIYITALKNLFRD